MEWECCRQEGRERKQRVVGFFRSLHGIEFMGVGDEGTPQAFSSVLEAYYCLPLAYVEVEGMRRRVIVITTCH
jgi:hypothetical protein